MPAGRPTEYTDEIGAKVCEAFACSSKGLRATLEDDPELPAYGTVLGWRRRHAKFEQAFAQAKMMQIEGFAEDIVDTSMDDSIEPNARRLIVDTKKWLLSKLMHRTYGEKLDVTSGGEALAPPSHQIDARVQSIIMQAMERRRGVAEEALPPDALKLLD